MSVHSCNGVREKSTPQWMFQLSYLHSILDELSKQELIKHICIVLASAGCQPDSIHPCLSKFVVPKVRNILRGGYNPFIDYGLTSQTIDEFVLDHFTPCKISSSIDIQATPSTADGNNCSKSTFDSIINASRDCTNECLHGGATFSRPHQNFPFSYYNNWDIGA